MSTESKVHGVSVRDRKTKELVEFMPCDYGKPALRILSGIRMNMSHEFIASEENVSQSEIDSIKKD